MLRLFRYSNKILGYWPTSLTPCFIQSSNRSWHLNPSFWISSCEKKVFSCLLKWLSETSKIWKEKTSKEAFRNKTKENKRVILSPNCIAQLQEKFTVYTFTHPYINTRAFFPQKKEKKIVKKPSEHPTHHLV